jgi:hypothetical protein
MLPAGYFDPLIRVIVIVTVRGVPHVLMDGVVTHQQVGPSNEPGRHTLTVTGEDLTALMDLIEVDRLHPPVIDAGKVALLIAQYALFGIVPLVVPELFPSVEIPIRRLTYFKGTDLDYLQISARQNGFVFYLEPGPVPATSIAYWGPEIRIGVPQPALNVNMDSHSNVEGLSFSFDGRSREQQAVLIPLPVVKLAIPIPIPDVSLLRPPLALKQAPSLRYKARTDSAKLDTPRAISRALADQARSADAVTGSGQLDVLRYGRPLKARRLVGVRGAGTSYDGLYYVKSVTHSIGRGSYTQSFSLARNGVVSITPRVVP